jgi:GNAT superfamily N-acetyltransferase
MADIETLARTETLRNGLAVTIRPMRPDDRDKVAASIGKLDRESVYSRLFSYRNHLTDAALDRIMTIDPDRDVTLLVTTGSGPGEVVIASGHYTVSIAAESIRTAEVAFIVEEDFHRLGIASLLLLRLVEIARRQGIVAFEADVLARNKAMLGVFARSGLPMRQQHDDGVVHVTMGLELSPP